MSMRGNPWLALLRASRSTDDFMIAIWFHEEKNIKQDAYAIMQCLLFFISSQAGLHLLVYLKAECQRKKHKSHFSWTQMVRGLAISFTCRWGRNEELFCLVSFEQNPGYSSGWEPHTRILVTTAESWRAGPGLYTTCIFSWNNGFPFGSLISWTRRDLFWGPDCHRLSLLGLFRKTPGAEMIADEVTCLSEARSTRAELEPPRSPVPAPQLTPTQPKCKANSTAEAQPPGHPGSWHCWPSVAPDWVRLTVCIQHPLRHLQMG